MNGGRPHLRLVRTHFGRAELRGGGTASQRTKDLLKDLARPAHAQELETRVLQVIADAAQSREADRPYPEELPVALEVDSGSDIKFVRTAFGLEIVSDGGGVAFAAVTDRTLQKFRQTLDKYRRNAHGGGSAATLHEIATQQRRLEELLDADLLAHWPSLSKDDALVVDLSIGCAGDAVGKGFLEKEETWSEEEYQRRVQERKQSWIEAYQAWDREKERRVDQVLALVHFHGGSLLGSVQEDDLSSVHRLPDSVQMRVKISGEGIRDIVLNYPFLFEVSLPDEFEQHFAEQPDGDVATATVSAPETNAPVVCIMDSGIQAGHRLLAPAIRRDLARCFLPDTDETDVADYCQSGGHGTRVAGAAMWGDRPGEGRPVCWLANARILDEANSIPEQLYPPALTKQVVEYFASRGVRIFVHSVNARTPKRRRHMPAWAAEFDRLSASLDVLFLQSVGNIPTSSDQPTAPGVREHLAAGRAYPTYFEERSAWTTNPAVAMHSVVVGSVSARTLDRGTWKTLAPADRASAFSRPGPGMWDAPKPDIVDYGGDYSVSHHGGTIQVAFPGMMAELYPNLIRSTLHGPGPMAGRDTVGTSYTAPKAAWIAAQIAAELPNEPALAYRTLLVHSARWPESLEREAVSNPEKTQELRRHALQTLGLGIPSLERATGCTGTRTTMFTAGENRIGAREAHVYQVTLPDALLSISRKCRVLVEVTLAFSAEPRRTRQGKGGYFSTWVDWNTSKKDEGFDSFLARVIKDRDGKKDRGKHFPWVLGDQHGGLDDTLRNRGSVQKDWAEVDGEELPNDFGIAVRGHPGWDGRIDSKVPYCLAVTIELLRGDLDVDLYNQIEVGLDALRVGVPVGSGNLS